MADPVGCISLGIEVTKLLTTYFGAINDRKDEAERILQHVRNLDRILSALDNALSTPGFRGLRSATLVEHNIESCRVRMDELKQMCVYQTSRPRVSVSMA